MWAFDLGSEKCSKVESKGDVPVQEVGSVRMGYKSEMATTEW